MFLTTMSIDLQLAALLLAAVFGVAGVGKLLDLPGSRKAVEAFGVPAVLARPFGVLLPVLELGAAVLLVVPATLRVGALAGALLLAAFCAAISWNVARGRTPDCHCFGQLHSAPAGAPTLARNAALLTIAAYAASAGDLRWTIGAAAASALLVVGIGLRARDVDESLALSTPAPFFDLPSLDGGSVSLDELRGFGRPVLLIFSAADCGPCVALAPDVARWQRELAGEVTIAVLERNSRFDGPDEHGRKNVLIDRDLGVSSAYGAHGTPSAVLVSADGQIASALAPGAGAIEAFVASFTADRRFARRELLVRAAGASAALAGLVGAPARAAAFVGEATRCRFVRCGSQCCPRTAKCRTRSGRRVCVCPDGRLACGDRCCPPTFVCRTFVQNRRRVRRCVCPVGYVACRGRCVRTRTDPRNCGRCGQVCPPGTSCVNGACVAGDGSGTGPGGSGSCTCEPGQACCGGECTDLNTSEQHCGRCRQPCPEGKTCCEGRCIDLRSDPQNCGTCGKRCAEGEVCGNGGCLRRCPSGQQNCNGQCLSSTASDPANCGGCGLTCTGPFDTGECCSGECCDYNGQTCCPGGCKNTALDGENCGGCGVVCPPGAYCRFGTCTDPI